MAQQRIGISDIAIFLPRPEIDIDTIVGERGRLDGELGKRMRRAIETTGQNRMRFPEAWEDTTTLAARSALTLVRQNPDFDLSRLRYLASGTETGSIIPRLSPPMWRGCSSG